MPYSHIFWEQRPTTEATDLHNLPFENAHILCGEKLKINYNYCWGQSLQEQLSNKAWSISDFNQSGKKRITEPTNTLSLLQSFPYSLTSSATHKALQDPELVKYYRNVRSAFWHANAKGRFQKRRWVFNLPALETTSIWYCCLYLDEQGCSGWTLGPELPLNGIASRSTSTEQGADINSTAG